MKFANKLTIAGIIAAVQLSAGAAYAAASTKLGINRQADNDSYFTENNANNTHGLYSELMNENKSHQETENNLQIRNGQNDRHDRAKPGNRRDEYEKRMKEENERHDKEMRRRPHESRHEWKERKKREEERHRHEMEHIRSIFARIVADILAARHG